MLSNLGGSQKKKEYIERQNIIVTVIILMKVNRANIWLSDCHSPSEACRRHQQ